MGNNIELAQKFAPVIDDIYKMHGVSNILDAETKVDFTNAAEVKILKVSTSGLGDYDRSTGYPKGGVDASWETFKLTAERGKEIFVDRMDDEETLSKTFGTVVGRFMRDHVAPELDAYRFSKYASKAGISTTDAAILTKDTVIEAFDEAIRKFDEDEVPAEGRVLFVNSDLKPLLNGSVNRTFAGEGNVRTIVDSYNDIPIVYVPKSRFFTSITLADGTNTFGFAKTVDIGKNINFLLIQKEAVIQAIKLAQPKIYNPDDNINLDSWVFQFRLYHDAFVEDNKVAGIYLHKSTN